MKKEYKEKLYNFQDSILAYIFLEPYLPGFLCVIAELKTSRFLQLILYFLNKGNFLLGNSKKNRHMKRFFATKKNIKNKNENIKHKNEVQYIR